MNESRTKKVRVKFFRANQAARTADGWTWPETDDVGLALAERVEKLGAEGNDLVTNWAGSNYFVELHQSSEGPTRLGVSRVRTDNLPLVLKAGQKTGEPLGLDDRDRLLEPTYLSFYGDRIVALVRSGNAPTHGPVANALARLTNVDIALDPVARTDVLLMVQRGSAVSSVDIAIAAGSIDVANERSDPVIAAQRVLTTVPPAASLKLTVSADTDDSKRGLRSWLIEFLKERGTQGLEGGHARLVTEDGRSDLVDLIEDDIATTVSVPVGGKTRHLLPEAAAEAADKAFDQLHTVLSHAIIVSE